MKDEDAFTEIDLTKVEQVTWFDQHFYQFLNPDGTEEFFPSVTTILQVSPKPFLNRWRGDLGNEEADRIKNEGAERGSNIHFACDILKQGGAVVLMQGHKARYSDAEIAEIKKKHNGLIALIWDQFEYLQVYRYLQFLQEIKPIDIGSEETVFSLKHRFAGTLDDRYLLKTGTYNINGSKPIKLDEGMYISDIKSSKTITDDNYNQLAAYWVAKEEMSGEQIDGALLVHTNATTKSGIEGLSTKLITRPEMEEYFDQFLKLFAVWRIKPSPAHPKIFSMPNQLTWKVAS